MTGKLLTATIQAPGFMGLNSQDSEVTLESGFATTASNCVIDQSGRLASRRGYEVLTTTPTPIEFIYEFKNTDGVYTILSAGAGNLYEGVETLVQKNVRNSTNDANVSLASTSNWQAASLQDSSGFLALGEVYLGQLGSPLLIYKEVNNDYIFQQVGDIGSVPTNITTATFDPNCVVAGFGRIWCANLSNDKTTVYYSNLLDGHTFTGAGSGLLNISAVVGGNDEITAIAVHNNYLVIFLQNNIVVYSGADDVTTLQLADVITGVGCIARDSVQQTGTDLIFLSRSGVRSLARTIQEKSMPMRELSINVRDVLVLDLGNEVSANIKSVYYERDAVYLLNLPQTNKIYCFDMRVTLQNGAARTTTWTTSYNQFEVTEDRRLLIATPLGIAAYRSYADNGQPYRMVYFTSNTNVGAEAQLKFLKKGNALIIGTKTQDLVMKYGFDYQILSESRIFLGATDDGASFYNVDEFGVGEYSGGLNILEARLNLGSSGRVIKLGIETEVNGAPISVQKLEVMFKIGKVY